MPSWPQTDPHILRKCNQLSRQQLHVLDAFPVHGIMTISSVIVHLHYQTDPLNDGDLNSPSLSPLDSPQLVHHEIWEYC